MLNHTRFTRIFKLMKMCCNRCFIFNSGLSDKCFLLVYFVFVSIKECVIVSLLFIVWLLHPWKKYYNSMFYLCFYAIALSPPPLFLSHSKWRSVLKRRMRAVFPVCWFSLRMMTTFRVSANFLWITSS